MEESTKVKNNPTNMAQKRILNDPKLKEWVASIPGNPKSVYCKICNKQLLNWSRRDLYKHANTLQHETYKIINNTDFSNQIFKTNPMKKKKSRLDASIIKTSDGNQITINLAPTVNDDLNIEEHSSEAGSNTDNEDNRKKNEVCEKYSNDQFDEWLKVDGSDVSCTVCKIKIKSTKIGVFKHSIGKLHSKKLAKSTGRKISWFRDSQIAANDFTLAINRISCGIQLTIDLRTDSIMIPGKNMKEAMLAAKLGDDYFQNDVNINNLQDTVAHLLNKSSGLLFPSGHMANLVAVLSHSWSRDSQVVMGDYSQQYFNSSKSFSMLGRIPIRTVENEIDGTFSLEQLEEILLSEHDWMLPTTNIVCVENAHTRMGGKVLPIEWLEKLSTMCAHNNAVIHLDGTRFMNAALVYEKEPHYSATFCDSVTFCLDTGLGTPIGAVLVGSTEFIIRAREIRNMLGGTINQMGIFAAAGLYSLEKNNVDRLLHDHISAKKIAQGIFDSESCVICVNLNEVQTNIIHVYTDNIRLSAKMLCERLEEITPQEIPLLEGRRVSILATPLTESIVQLMTHIDLSVMDVELIMQKFTIIIQEFDSDVELLA